MLELFSYSNVFVCYKHLSTSGQKRNLYLKPFNGYFPVVGLYACEETCILLKSPFHAELNGQYPNSVY